MNGAQLHPILQVRNLARTFGSKVVHRNISFDLYPGEILGLIGTSGSGKSLILKTLIGLSIPDAGQIVFDGQNLCAMNEDAYRRIRLRIGYVFQNGALFNSLTVEENLSYPLRLHTRLSSMEILKKVNERLKMFDLNGTNHLYPDEISGGMERRVGLLRSTMLDPPIVLFDEPTAGLDPTLVAVFASQLQSFKRERGFTGILVTHDIECLFAVADRIIMIHEGIVHATGTVEEMRRSTDPCIRSFLFPNFGGRS